MENKYIQNNALELCNVPIYAVDKDCRYTFVNSAYIKVVQKSRGLSVAEGDSHLDVVSSNSGIDRIRTIDAFNQVMAGQQFQAIDECGEPDKYRAPYESTYSPIIEHDGNVIGMIVFAQDITDRIKLQNKLSEQNHKIENQAKRLKDAGIMKDRLLSIIAHDLRSPIGNLNLCIQLINEHKLTSDETLHLLGMIGRSTRAINKTLDDLLDWSISDPKFDKQNIESFNLSEFFNDQVNMYATLADQKKVNLSISVPDTVACADRRKISLLIRNMIDNAIKYTNTNGQVEVGLLREEKSCRIYCMNTGKMENKIKQKILDGKNTFHTNGTQGEKGTGLGLLLCKEILANMNSSLEINNTLDQTIFSFVLPREVMSC